MIVYVSENIVCWSTTVIVQAKKWPQHQQLVLEIAQGSIYAKRDKLLVVKLPH